MTQIPNNDNLETNLETENFDPTFAPNTQVQEEVSEAVSETSTSSNDDFKAKFEDMQNKYLRLYADYENFKRDTTLQKSQDDRRTRKQIITTAILPLLDNLKLATDYAPKTQDASLQKYIQSVENILKKSIVDMGKIGAIILIPEIGQDFDQITMEAISTIPATENSKPHSVVTVVSFGLKIADIVIQPARVVISE